MLLEDIAMFALCLLMAAVLIGVGVFVLPAGLPGHPNLFWIGAGIAVVAVGYKSTIGAD